MAINQQKRKVIILAGILFILLAAIFVTSLLAQKQQKTRSRAAASTTLAFAPSSSSSTPLIRTVGDTVSLDIIVKPGTNMPNFLNLEMVYDATKFEPLQNPITVINSLNIQDGPIITNGKIVVSLSAGLDPTGIIQAETKIATIFLKALNTTSSPTQVAFGPNTAVFSAAPSDAADENVLASTQPAYISVTTQSPTVTSLPTPTPTSQPTSCTLPAPPTTGEYYEAVMTGSQEVPPVTTSATGKARARIETFSNGTSVIHVDFCYTGLSSANNGTHIHLPAPAGQEAPVVLTLPSSGATSFSYTDHTASITSQWISDLRNGLWYINVHTISFPDGEIRGQFGQGTGGPPTSTATPTPTRTPTPVLPSATPTRTPTPTQSGPTPTVPSFAFTVFLHGIGGSGDSANPDPSLSNKNPLRTSRTMKVEYYNSQNTLVMQTTGTLTYSIQNGNYVESITAPNTLPSGSYTIKIFVDQHLKKAIPGIFTLPLTGSRILEAVSLIAGDINGDNKINILDYNLLMDCYSELTGPRACTVEKKIQTDLNDDGFVNSFDYSLFIRDHNEQFGD